MGYQFRLIIFVVNIINVIAMDCNGCLMLYIGKISAETSDLVSTSTAHEGY